MAERHEPLVDEICDRGLACSGQAGEPDNTPALTLLGRTNGTINLDGLPVYVLRAAQSEVEQASPDGIVGQPIDKNEPAERTAGRVRLERHGLIELELAHADVV